ncbi:hydroxyacid-oxoacid transhydrogenase [Magnetospirillum fulvum]|uniref:hydroxyacid-oxoacid transhydrogenase n=1 Tax=Magnetospirillum fulvum TaxID=1082 RepID=A0A1H6GQH2_MAGFU|nr:hydroxyacid-oxoacid transhydrogenase [Magnetospirillum fulvum]SEH25531.1 Alcohol dehydrogenase, class IV [Magnetospirillum fulvum]
MTHEHAFSLHVPDLVFGRGALAEVGEHARALGLTRVLLVTDRTLRPLAPVTRVETALRDAGIEVILHDFVAIEPTESAIDRAGAAGQIHGIDGFISVGGGSSIDTAKGANLLVSRGGRIADFLPPPLGAGRTLGGGPLLPHIACPTTFGTAAETTGIVAFALDHGRGKTTLTGAPLRPSLGLLDPTALLTLPPMVLAANAFDLLSHAIESETARPFESRPAPADPARRPVTQGANPFASLGCREAIRLVAGALGPALDDPTDIESREQLMRAGLLAGTVFGMSGNHLPHALSYPISTLAHRWTAPDYPDDHPFLPHGLSVALAAPAVFRHLERRLPDRFAPVARALATDSVADALIALMRRAGLPNGLTAIGLSDEHHPALVEGALAQRRLIDNAPLTPTAADLAAILADARRYWS